MQYQFWFIQYNTFWHSTQQVIITVFEKITSSLDNGHLVIGVFLHLKKTFDTVDHQILLKTVFVWYQDNILKWFESYLSYHSMLLMMKYNQKFYLSSVGFHRDQYLVLCCLLFTRVTYAMCLIFYMQYYIQITLVYC